MDQYVSLSQLLKYLLATDIYVIPYLNPDQIVSGTLAYALGCGKAVVSTPFIHAKEALAQGRGLLAPFCDAPALANAIRRLLNEPDLRQSIEQRAYAGSRSWVWSEVAWQYNAVYQEAVGQAVSQTKFLPLALPMLNPAASSHNRDTPRPQSYPPSP